MVFQAPPALVQAGYDPRSALIKRVIGAPGDVVAVQDGALWRNGERVEEPWRPEPIDYRFGPVTVPAGHLMVLGDNRNASFDSHLWGPLPEGDVIGTAVLRYWPLNRLGAIRFSTPEGLDRPEQLG